MRIVASLLRVFGMIWALGLASVIVFGTAAYIYFAPSKWEAIQKVQADWSPFNVRGWIVNMILASPALVSIALSDWLRRRAAPRQPLEHADKTLT